MAKWLQTNFTAGKTDVPREAAMRNLIIMRREDLMFTVWAAIFSEDCEESMDGLEYMERVNLDLAMLSLSRTVPFREADTYHLADPGFADLN
jgi:hypothetical protein